MKFSLNEISTNKNNEISQLKFQLESANNDNEELLLSVDSLEGQLKTIAGPLDDKISELSLKLQHLTSENESLHNEIVDLSTVNDQLTQHGNSKQKIQYHIKIKQENNELKEEIQALKEENQRLKQLRSQSEAVRNTSRMI